MKSVRLLILILILIPLPIFAAGQTIPNRDLDADVRDGRFRQRAEIVDIRRIDTPRDRPAARGVDLVGNTRRAVDLDVGDDDIHAGGRESQRDTSADTAAPADDDRGAIGEFIHLSTLRRVAYIGRGSRVSSPLATSVTWPPTNTFEPSVRTCRKLERPIANP